MSKMRLLAPIMALLTTISAYPAWPQSITESDGRILNIWVDPSDFILQLSVKGRCGSNFFHVQRDNANFREMVTTMLTGFTTAKSVGLYVKGCNGDRNVVSHGFVNG